MCEVCIACTRVCVCVCVCMCMSVLVCVCLMRQCCGHFVLLQVVVVEHEERSNLADKFKSSA